MIKVISLFTMMFLLNGCGTVNVKNIDNSNLPNRTEIKSSLKELERKYDLINLYSFDKVSNDTNTYPFSIKPLINAWGKPNNIYKVPNNISDYVKPNLYCGVAALVPGLQGEAILCFIGVNGLVYGSHKMNTNETLTWNISNKRIKVYTSEKETTQGIIRVVNDWEWCELNDSKKYYYSDGEKCF